MFHGPCHLRVNLPLPLARVREAMEKAGQACVQRTGIVTKNRPLSPFPCHLNDSIKACFPSLYS